MSTPPLAQKITHSVTVQRRDGSTVTHTAEFTQYMVHEAVSGVVAVEAICDGDLSTAARHTLPNDLAGMADADILAEVQVHVKRVAELHAARDRAVDYLSSLLPQPSSAPAPPPLTPKPSP